LLDHLSGIFARSVVPDDIAAYSYSVLCNSSYVRRYWEELETPGPRVPITKSAGLFFEAVQQGKRLIWLHTYAERMRGAGRSDEVPQGAARCLRAVSDAPSAYPEDFAYIEADRNLRVGDGLFSPVNSEVWAYSVSGLQIIDSWLGYRMKRRGGKKSSPLDDIRPEHWTPRMTDEFLELLWVIEATVALEPELASLLDRVVSGPCFSASELPAPTATERAAPKFGMDDDRITMFDEAEAAENDEDE